MAKVRKVDYFAVHVANRPGEAAMALEAFKRQGVNLLAFTGFPDGRGSQMDFIPEKTATFIAAARKAKLRIKPKKQGFLIQGSDAPGAVAGVMKKLAKAKINVTAVDAVSAGNGRYGAIFWVKPKDVARTARTLKA